MDLTSPSAISACKQKNECDWSHIGADRRNLQYVYKVDASTCAVMAALTQTDQLLTPTPPAIYEVVWFNNRAPGFLTFINNHKRQNVRGNVFLTLACACQFKHGSKLMLPVRVPPQWQ